MGMATKSYPLILYSDTDALFYGNPFWQRYPFLFCKVVCLYVSTKIVNICIICPSRIPQTVSAIGSLVSSPSVSAVYIIEPFRIIKKLCVFQKVVHCIIWCIICICTIWVYICDIILKMQKMRMPKHPHFQNQPQEEKSSS